MIISAAISTSTATPPPPPRDPKDPFYGSRWERSFALSPAAADRLQELVARHVAADDRFPNPQDIQTVYVRSIDPKGPKEKFRIRTYPDSPGPPTHLEFKDRVERDGQKYTEKTRISVANDTALRLLWGETGAAVIGLDGRVGADLVVARRAIAAVDDLGLRPVLRQQYRRTSFEDAVAGVRITFDRGIRYTGIGELARAGSGSTDHAIMDVKMIGKTPDWLSAMLDAELGAGTIREVEDGKGSTAIKELVRRLAQPKPRAA